MCLSQNDKLKGELEMENVYVLVTYVAVLIALVGCGLLKVGDILEKRRNWEYYQMIKDDASFWQMKVEQTGINVIDWMLDQGMDKMMKQVKEMTTQMMVDSGEPKEADGKFKEEFEGLNDDWIDI